MGAQGASRHPNVAVSDAGSQGQDPRDGVAERRGDLAQPPRRLKGKRTLSGKDAKLALNKT